MATMALRTLRSKAVYLVQDDQLGSNSAKNELASMFEVKHTISYPVVSVKHVVLIAEGNGSAHPDMPTDNVQSTINRDI